MVWPGDLARTAHIHVPDLTQNSPHPQVIHWAGLGWGKALTEMPRSDILLHFEDLYYSRIPFGSWLRPSRHGQFWADRRLVAPLKHGVKHILRRV